MANTIRLKRASGSDPGASDLVTGELAVRTDTGKLFTKKDDNSVTEIGASIGSDAVDTAAIQDDAVTTAKVAAGNITETELASNAVTGAKIATGAINNANKIQDSIITGAKIGSGTIDAGNIASNAVTTAKIADDAVTQAKMADNAIGTSQLANNAVYTAAIQDDAVTSAKIASNSVTNDSIDNDSIHGDKLTSATISTAKLADDAVTFAKIQNVSATDRLLGRDSSGAGIIEEIAPSAVRTMLGLATSATTDTTNASNISSGTLAAARIPTLNQDTTGSAATLTTARTIAGVSFDGSANISLNNNAITNGAGYITSADGGNAATLDGIDSSQFVRLDLDASSNQDVGGLLSLSTGLSFGADARCNAAVSSLSDGSTITVDFISGIHHSVTLGGNRTFGNPSNDQHAVGQSGSIFITQDGTGSRTASFHSDYKFVGGTAPTLSTAANAVDRIDYVIKASGVIHCAISLDVK